MAISSLFDIVTRFPKKALETTSSLITGNDPKNTETNNATLLGKAAIVEGIGLHFLTDPVVYSTSSTRITKREITIDGNSRNSLIFGHLLPAWKLRERRTRGTDQHENALKKLLEQEIAYCLDTELVGKIQENIEKISTDLESLIQKLTDYYEQFNHFEQNENRLKNLSISALERSIQNLSDRLAYIAIFIVMRLSIGLDDDDHDTKDLLIKWNQSRSKLFAANETLKKVVKCFDEAYPTCKSFSNLRKTIKIPNAMHTFYKAHHRMIYIAMGVILVSRPSTIFNLTGRIFNIAYQNMTLPIVLGMLGSSIGFLLSKQINQNNVKNLADKFVLEPVGLTKKEQIENAILEKEQIQRKLKQTIELKKNAEKHKIKITKTIKKLNRLKEEIASVLNGGSLGKMGGWFGWTSQPMNRIAKKDLKDQILSAFKDQQELTEILKGKFEKNFKNSLRWIRDNKILDQHLQYLEKKFNRLIARIIYLQNSENTLRKRLQFLNDLFVELVQN